MPKVPRYLATPHYGLYNNVCQETRNQNKPYSWVQRETRQKTSQRGGLQICRRQLYKPICNVFVALSVNIGRHRLALTMLKFGTIAKGREGTWPESVRAGLRTKS